MKDAYRLKYITTGMPYHAYNPGLVISSGVCPHDMDMFAHGLNVGVKSGR